MLWGLDQLTQFQNLVKPGYSNIVLAYNEWVHGLLFFSNIKFNYLIRPDLSSQANLDPETAAQTWIANGQPLRNQGYSTLAPAVAFNSSWLSSFFDACKGCQVRIVSYHYVLRHGFNNSFFASGMAWLRTFTLLMRRIWLITLPHFTILLTCPSGWQNLPARSVVICLLGDWSNNTLVVIGFQWRSTVWRKPGFLLHDHGHAVDGRDWVYCQVFRLRYVWTLAVGNCNLDLPVSGVMTAAEININPLNALMNPDGTPNALGNLYLGN